LVICRCGEMDSREIESILKQNIESLEERIQESCRRASRDRGEIRLIAVTKYVGAEVARLLVSLGLKDLGENRLQVAAPKLEALADLPVCWHWIGHLQTNKVKNALKSFHVFHSVDRPSLVEAFNQRRADSGQEPLPVYLQVNVSGEESKFGTKAEEIEKLGEMILESPQLDWLGLMTMAPFEEDPEKTRPVFAGLREVRDRLEARFGISLPRLSMGMSNDFEIAIEEGATDLRIGTVLYEGLWG